MVVIAGQTVTPGCYRSTNIRFSKLISETNITFFWTNRQKNSIGTYQSDQTPGPPEDTSLEATLSVNRLEAEWQVKERADDERTYVSERASDRALRRSSASLHPSPASVVGRAERSGDRVTHTNKGGKTAEHLRGRKEQNASVAITNTWRPRRATATAGTGEQRKRPRTATAPLKIKVRIAPPTNCSAPQWQCGEQHIYPLAFSGGRHKLSGSEVS